MVGNERSEQLAFMSLTLQRLSMKAKLTYVPGLCTSKTERFANVNVFRRRVSVGENLLKLWSEGNFTDQDLEAILAHEIGHLMDFGSDSHSSSFRNIMLECLWFSFGIVPLIAYLLTPTLWVLAFSVLLALGWGFSLPWIVRRIEVGVEFEADRKAAVSLVEPNHLANTLLKISSFVSTRGGLGLTTRLVTGAGKLTHPSFSDRVCRLKSLQPSSRRISGGW